MDTLVQAPRLESKELTPPGGRDGALFNDLFKVEPGRARYLNLSGGRPDQNRILSLVGEQTVRTIYLVGDDGLLSDAYVTGSQSMKIPTRARRVVLIGEGLEPAVSPVGARRAVSMTQEAVGIEQDSIVLALGRRTFAAHGCIVESRVPLAVQAEPLDSVPGLELLDTATNFRLHFPVTPRGWSLLLVVRPNADDPGSALNEVRWVSLDAKLGKLETVIGIEKTAFIMPVLAVAPWKLDVDLGPNWRMTNLVVLPIHPP